jgi:cell division protein FtsI/penicillin-binding protein 2
VTATPIAVTSIYASLATGKTVHPRLVQTGAAGATDTPSEGQPIIDQNSPVQKQLFAAVTAGLHGVVMTPRGTANRYFADAPYRERIFGKTGTATTTETRGERQYSAWFAGWIEPGPQGAKGMGRRVAFACWVTHTRDFGGTACAPIIKKLLSATETLEPIP